ncbi:hypothetical protein ACKKBG_A11235 [Auxenochlorella protothecoides x Auxenochlorella symbiontica]
MNLLLGARSRARSYPFDCTFDTLTIRGEARCIRRMRAGPKLALATITLLSAWGIATVHWYQQEEREALHKGVIRDEELYKLKVEQFRKAAQHQGGSN